MKIKKLNDMARIPTRGSEGAAGYDLYAATSCDIEIPPFSAVKIGTGLAMEIPNGFFGGIFPRSGIASKRGLRPSNCVGVVDQDYRGEILVSMHNDTDTVQTVCAGERIAQLIILPYLTIDFEEVNDLNDTNRGSSGFGSTGVK